MVLIVLELAFRVRLTLNSDPLVLGIKGFYKRAR